MLIHFYFYGMAAVHFHRNPIVFVRISYSAKTNSTETIKAKFAKLKTWQISPTTQATKIMPIRLDGGAMLSLVWFGP